MNLRLIGRLRDALTAAAVNSINDNIGIIITVGNSVGDVSQVAMNITDIQAVSQNESNINAVANNLVSILAVANDESDIGIVASNIQVIDDVAADIGPVAASISAIELVAASDAAINNVSQNMTDVLNASAIVGTLEVNRPAQNSRVEAVKTFNSRGTGNQWEDASVNASNVRLRSVSNFNDVLFVDNISVNVNIVDNFFLEASSSNTGLSYVYIAYDSVADSTVYYCTSIGYYNPSSLNSNLPANITHVAFLGAFLVNDEGSMMINRELYPNREYRDTDTQTLTGADLPYSETLAISFLGTLTGVYEGVLEIHKPSGSAPTRTSLFFDFNGNQVFTRAASDTYLLVVGSRSRYPVVTSSPSVLITGTIPSELGTGSIRFEWAIDKITLDPKGYLI